MGFLATLPASLISALGGAFFQSLFETLFGFLDKKNQDSAHEELGRTQDELEQAREAERVQAELADQASKRVSDDDALARLERGEA